MQSEARNAKNAPESAIRGVLRKRSTTTGSVLWRVPISFPRSAPRRVGRTNLCRQRSPDTARRNGLARLPRPPPPAVLGGTPRSPALLIIGPRLLRPAPLHQRGKLRAPGRPGRAPVPSCYAIIAEPAPNSATCHPCRTFWGRPFPGENITFSRTDPFLLGRLAKPSGNT